MRRALFLSAGLVVLVASRATANDPRAVAWNDVLTQEDYWEELTDTPLPAMGIPSTDDPTLDDDADASTVALARTLRATRVRIHASSYRVTEGGGAASGVLAADATTLDDAAVNAVRTAVVAGSLKPLEAVTLVGALDEELHAANHEATQVLWRHDLECAIGVAVTWTNSATLRSGLDIRARVAPHVDGAHVVTFQFSVATPGDVSSITTTAGPRDTLAVDTFVARGCTVLDQGATACVRGIDTSGNGFVVLLRVSAPHTPSLPMTLGGERVAVPVAAFGSVLGNAASLGYQDERGVADSLVEWERLIPPLAESDGVDQLGALDRAVLEDTAPCGVQVLAVRPGDEDDVVRHARELLEDAGEISVVAAHPGAGRIVVPALPGTTPRAFLGRISTRLGHPNVETGCHESIGVIDFLEMAWEGLAFSLSMPREGPAEVDLAARIVESEEHRTFPARRLLFTHDAFEFDDMPVRFTTDRELRVRTRLPTGGGRLPDGAEVRLRGHAVADGETPRAVTVNGEPLYVTPAYAARFIQIHRAPHVLAWEWDGSCAMTFRYPYVHHIAVGVDCAVRLHSDGELLDIAGAVTGTPVTLQPDFDMADGIMQIKRTPHLAVTTRVPVGAARRVAWAGDLVIDVGAPDSAARHELRTARIDIGAKGCGVRFMESERVTLDAGGSAWLPAELDHYHSNHSTGESQVEAVQFVDGAVLELRDTGKDLMRGFVDIRERPTLRGFELRKRQTPRRPDVDTNLLLPSRAEFSWPLFVPQGRPLDRTSATGNTPVRVSVAVATTKDED